MIPVACYRLISSNLIVDFAAFTRPDHGVPANVAYAHHDSNRNVLDEWV